MIFFGIIANGSPALFSLQIKIRHLIMYPGKSLFTFVDGLQIIHGVYAIGALGYRPIWLIHDSS